MQCRLQVREGCGMRLLSYRLCIREMAKTAAQKTLVSKGDWSMGTGLALQCMPCSTAAACSICQLV
jgi:hypothetical protein